MLWYKAWLETRSRFVIAIVGTVFLCSWFVLHGDRVGLPYSQADYFNMVLHSCHILLVLMWVLSVTVLMMGGLLREKAMGSSAFTLALPVKRKQMMMARIGVGFVEAIALAVLPWAAMFAVGSIFGKTHSISQALFHVVLLLGGGLVIFSIAVLASSLLEGEYMANIVGMGVVMTMLVMDKPRWRPYNPLQFMMGDGRVLRHVLTGPIPWLQVAAYVSFAALLLVVSVKAIQRREF